MSQPGSRQRLRVGLQSKSALILALLVLGVTVAGGWFYLDAASQSLRGAERQHAVHLARALGMAGQYDLRQGQSLALQRLADDFLRNDNVRYVALLDARGLVVASACADEDPERWDFLAAIPPAISTTRRLGDDVLVLARPIIMRDVIWFDERLVGAVRIAFDTRATTAKLAGVERRMTAIATAIVLVSIPLGYLLVFRLMIKPLRRLLAVTGRLAKGDFAARADLRRGDEIGHLGAAFDSMAAELAQMRDELLAANEQLERKVAQRTEELELANARLRSEMTEKEDFLRAVSHDLNAPLRNIAGMATLILLKWRDELPEEVIARLQRVQANVDAETSLITELLELSRIRTRPQKRQMLDMGQLIRGLVETFDYELKSRRITLDLDAEMPRLYVEPSRLRQVFQNLIDNAIKYMHRPEGGRIHVGYRPTERMHVFSVADNGPGIHPAQHEKVFCVFRRAENAAAHVQGKGVGLALVKSVVSNYDGRAWVESDLGQGATFHVALGRSNTEAPRPAESDETPSPDNIEADYHPVGG
jgi:signal transduction histidine kinase